MEVLLRQYTNRQQKKVKTEVYHFQSILLKVTDKSMDWQLAFFHLLKLLFVCLFVCFLSEFKQGLTFYYTNNHLKKHTQLQSQRQINRYEKTREYLSWLKIYLVEVTDKNID